MSNDKPTPMFAIKFETFILNSCDELSFFFQA